MKHTPGPWIASFTNRKDPFARAYIKHPSGFVCGIYGGRTEEVCGADEADANARLIAAAPELLEAIKYIQTYNSQAIGRYGENTETHLIKVACENAIVKAEGGGI